MIFCKLDTWVPYKMFALTSPGTGAQGDEFATTSPVILGAAFAGRKACKLVEQPALRCKFLPVSQDRRLRIATVTAGGQARYGLALRRPNKGTFKSLCERLWRNCTWTLQYKSAPLGRNVPLVDASLLFVRMTKDFTRTLTYTNADITEGIKTLGASLAKSTGHKPWDLRREKAIPQRLFGPAKNPPRISQTQWSWTFWGRGVGEKSGGLWDWPVVSGWNQSDPQTCSQDLLAADWN